MLLLVSGEESGTFLLVSGKEWVNALIQPQQGERELYFLSPERRLVTLLLVTGEASDNALAH